MSSTLNFCTLFDQGYLLRGLSLLQSLEAVEADFHLYILAMDSRTAQILTELKLQHTTIISLNDFESPELIALKPSRSRGEYCWTCTPHLIRYCLDQFNLDNCTYLDADIFFFSSPRILIEEIKQDSVLITDHRYTPRYDQTNTSGKYCVQFMYFKKTENGNTVLNWWRDRCTEWCYARQEDGKFGDQKYLDDWTTRFSGVHELRNLGGGLAPWNIQQYQIKNTEPLRLSENNSHKEFDGVFYHFHDLKFLSISTCDLGQYDLSEEIIRGIYAPYIRTIERKRESLVQKYSEAFDFQAGSKANLKFIRNYIKRLIKGTLHYRKTNVLIKDCR